MLPCPELPEWVLRQLHIWWQEDNPRCWCTFEDTDEVTESSHPTPGCSLRTDCGGWGWDPPCGGCDRCLSDQARYYQGKEREEAVRRAVSALRKMWAIRLHSAGKLPESGWERDLAAEMRLDEPVTRAAEPGHSALP
jgi:hypothetical protein